MENCDTCASVQEGTCRKSVTITGEFPCSVFLGKVLALVLLERLHTIIDPQLMEAQCGFRKGCGTVNQLWVVRQVVERATEYRNPLYLCFVDLTKAYNSVNRQAMTAILKKYGVPKQLVEIIKELYTGTLDEGSCKLPKRWKTIGHFG